MRRPDKSSLVASLWSSIAICCLKLIYAKADRLNFLWSFRVYWCCCVPFFELRKPTPRISGCFFFLKTHLYVILWSKDAGSSWCRLCIRCRNQIQPVEISQYFLWLVASVLSPNTIMTESVTFPGKNIREKKIPTLSRARQRTFSVDLRLLCSWCNMHFICKTSQKILCS